MACRWEGIMSGMGIVVKMLSGRERIVKSRVYALTQNKNSIKLDFDCCERQIENAREIWHERKE